MSDSAGLDLAFVGTPGASPSRLATLAARTRPGSYDAFLADMIEALRAADPTLAAVAPDAATAGDWLWALLDAWATVGATLSFYQGQIAREGFLATAGQDDSLHMLLASIGYRRFPGVAGTAQILVNVTETTSVANATRIRTIPAPGEAPQYYETTHPLSARLEWNRAPLAIAATRPTPSVALAQDMVTIAGVNRSLANGSFVLLAGQSAGGPPSVTTALRTVVGVANAPGTLPGSTDTAVTLAPLGSPQAPATLLDPAIYRFRARSAMFGATAPAWSGLPEAIKARHAPVQGGVTRLAPGGAAWEPDNDGLPASPETGLAVTAADTLLAATPSGVFRRPGGAAGSWRVVTSLPRSGITALWASSDAGILVGTALGRVFRSRDDGVSWEDISSALAPRGSNTAALPALPVRSFAGIPGSGGSVILAGTDGGIFRADPVGQGWRPSQRGLPGGGSTPATVAVTAFALRPDDGSLFAATSAGMFASTDKGTSWRSVGGTAAGAITLLLGVVDAATHGFWLFAQDANGLRRSSDGGATWTPAGAGLDGKPMQAMTSVPDNAGQTTSLLAGSATAVVRSGDLGQSWQLVPGGPGGPCSGICTLSDGSNAIATPLLGVTATEWPGFSVAPGQIDLGSVQDPIEAGSWVVITQESAGKPTQWEACRVISAGHVFRSDFGLNRLVTRILVDPATRLDLFNLREAEVLVGSIPLALPDDGAPPPISGGGTIELALADNPAIRGLPSGQPVLIVARAPKVRLPGGAPWYDVLGMRKAAGGKCALTLQSRDGTPLLGEYDPAALTWLRTDEQSPEVWYRAVFTRIPGSATGNLRLPDRAPPMDPQSLSLAANVVMASQGLTVDDEVLGSGDPQAPNQTFRLSSAPLTWLRDSATAEPEPQLTVTIDGVPWARVDDFLASGPASRVYQLSLDADGGATIEFGDGQFGSRLPKGTDNVRATYRVGMQSSAAAENQISVLLDKNVGVAQATNPLPGQAPIAAESVHEARRQAGRVYGRLHRLVSLQDYEDFVVTRDGFRAARAQWFDMPEGRLLLVTVAPDAGVAWPDPALLESLHADMVAEQDRPGRVRVMGFTPVQLALEAQIALHAGSDPASALATIRGLLTTRFGAAGGNFGDVAALSDVVALIRSDSSVAGVTVEALYRSGLPATRETAIQAASGRLDRNSGTLRPAELLVFEPATVDLRIGGAHA